MPIYNEPSSISREDARLQAQIEARNLRAMREAAQETEPPRLYESKDFDMMDDTQEKLSNKWRKEQAFLIQNEDISNNAITDELGYTPTKIKSDITQEMIDDYKAEHETPLILNGKAYPYHPASLDIELETFTPQPFRINPDDIDEAEARLEALTKRYTELQAQIVQIESVDRPALDQAYNEGRREIFSYTGTETLLQDKLAKIDLAILEVERMRTKEELQAAADKYDVKYAASSKPQTIKKRILEKLEAAKTKMSPAKKTRPKKTIDQLEQEYQDEITDLIQYRDQLKGQCDQVQMDMENLDALIKDTHKIEYENYLEEGRVRRENDAKLQTKRDELEILNKGAMAPRGDAETEEDFKARLIRSGQKTLGDKADEEQAKLEHLEKCKNNLKGFVSDAAKISTIANKLTPDERFEFNKLIIPIKKKYLDTYGFDKKLITEQEIAQFIKEAIATKNFASPNSAPPVTATGPIATAPAATASAERQAKDYKQLSNYSRGELIRIIQDHNQNIPTDSSTTRPQMYNELLKAGLIPLKGSRSHIPPSPAAATGGAGLGIDREQLSHHAKFGDYYISPHNLHFKNVLSVRSRTRKPMNGYKDIRVSDTLASIIMKILKGETINRHDLALLSEKEQMIYDNLIYMSKLHKTHHNSVEDTVKKMKDRFKVLEGELEAGNNNELILKELHDLLFKMAKNNMISHSSAVTYWKQIKNNI